MMPDENNHISPVQSRQFSNDPEVASGVIPTSN
jgi:hypothetical protein